jgi:hypothetical protein
MGKSLRKKNKTSDEIKNGGMNSFKSFYDTESSQKTYTYKTQNLKYYVASAVSLLTFLVFLPALQNEFVNWDDPDYVIENSHIRSFNLIFLKWAFFDFYKGNWHPLTWISHAMDYAVWGLTPLGHHLTNNMLHTVNTFFVVFLIIRLLEIRKKLMTTDNTSTFPDERGMLITAGVTGLLFGIHPLHVESVAWISERKDLLCALFILLSILMYTRYLTPPASPPPLTLRGGRGSYLLSLSFFILALLSKPMAVTFPLVILILDWYPFRRITTFATFRIVFIEKLPFIALSLFSSVITILAQKAGGAVVELESIPLSTRMLVALHSLMSYLWKMIIPAHLVPYYRYPHNVSLFTAEYLTIIILTGGITAICIIAAMKRRKFILSVWAYYIFTLLPVLGLVQVGRQAMADRYTYLPSLGPFLIIGIAVVGISAKLNIVQKWKRFVRMLSGIAAVSVLIVLIYLTSEQIVIWKEGISLWSYVTEKDPDSAYSHLNLGVAYGNKGLNDKAIDNYNKALELGLESDYRLYFNLGKAYAFKGFIDNAIDNFRIALELKPYSANTNYELGIAYLRKGLIDQAIVYLEIAVRLNPDNSFFRGDLYYAYEEREHRKDKQ